MALTKRPSGPQQRQPHHVPATQRPVKRSNINRVTNGKRYASKGPPKSWDWDLDESRQVHFFETGLVHGGLHTDCYKVRGFVGNYQLKRLGN